MKNVVSKVFLGGFLMRPHSLFHCRKTLRRHGIRMVFS